jgi:hypothetical protein
MLSLLKLIIWICGSLVVAYFLLNFFGFEINKDYFKASKVECQRRIDECKNELIHNGVDGARCDLNCADPKLIINKKQ